ncbi:unnamed protein product [Effrenium voratum]|nr:unnamed protein product [Effrenium voratum]
MREANLWALALRLLPSDGMSFVAAMNCAPWKEGLELLRRAPLARLQPFERLLNGAAATAAHARAWQAAARLLPRRGGAGELELLAACERTGSWLAAPLP